MRVVINAFSAKLGGGQTYLKQLLSRLPDDECEIILFAPKSLLLPDDARIERPEVRWPVDNPLMRALWERFALPHFLRARDADILFCPGGVVATTAPVGCHVVTMFRNMIPFTPELVKAMPWGLQKLRNLILKRVMLRSMARADLTIFISQFAKSVIEALGPVKRSVTIPHGISPEFRSFDRNLAKPAGAPEKPYLLYVSRFDIYKHHREVLEAFVQLPRAVRDSYTLVFIGEDHMPEAETVRRLAEMHGIAEQLLTTGPMPYNDLPAWYHHARLSIFASSCENCPNILLESLGAGRPVLSSNVMPMPEFGGDQIPYFTPDRPETLTPQLLTVLTDPLASEHVAKAAIAASARYDWKMTAQKTWQALRELAHG